MISLLRVTNHYFFYERWETMYKTGTIRLAQNNMESFFICWFSLPLSFAHTWLTGCSHTDWWPSYKKDRKAVEK